MSTQSKRLLREIVVFAMLANIMFCSKILMELLPNIHLLGMLTMVYTLTYGKRALIPIYVYVLINGLYAGFAPWWVPYLYVWTVLWGVTMLLPKNLQEKKAQVIFPLVCCLHGLLFGVLYAPAQAIMFGYNLKQTLAWIASGLYFDILHFIGNLATGLLVLPFTRLLQKLSRRIGIL